MGFIGALQFVNSSALSSYASSETPTSTASSETKNPTIETSTNLPTSSGYEGTTGTLIRTDSFTTASSEAQNGTKKPLTNLPTTSGGDGASGARISTSSFTTDSSAISDEVLYAAVGGVVGGVLLLLIIVMVVLRRRRSTMTIKRHSALELHYNDTQSRGEDYTKDHSNMYAVPHSMKPSKTSTERTSLSGHTNLAYDMSDGDETTTVHEKSTTGSDFGDMYATPDKNRRQPEGAENVDFCGLYATPLKTPNLSGSSERTALDNQTMMVENELYGSQM